MSPLPTPADLEVAWRTVWGEARGEPFEGKLAVAWVIRNRWQNQGGQFAADVTAAAACLRRWQFSCWLPADPNLPRLLAVPAGDPMALECLEAVARAFRAAPAADPTGGATHYHAAWLSPPPDWAAGREPSARIGRHLFFAGVP